jgi:hypothetical protein
MAIRRLLPVSAEIAHASHVPSIEMSRVPETNTHAVHGIELSGSRPIRRFPDFRTSAAVR